MTDKIKVLVVDDSITFRQILSNVIAKIVDAECVGTASSGQVALKKIPTIQPDLVLLDIMMPDMDGVETLKHIKQDYPHIEAIMISGFDMNYAKETLRSLDIGALDFIAKPRTSNADDSMAELLKYLQPLVHLVHTKKYARFSRQSPEFKKPATKPEAVNSERIKPAIPLSPNKVDLIVLGISTGGPKALDHIIPKLNSTMRCPMIIVQHMPPVFTQSLALKLNEETALTVAEVQGGEVLTAGHIYIAPGGKHIVLRARLEGGFYLATNETPPVNNCRPSVDVLFRSVATTFNGHVLAIVMTGMGRDGTDGVKMLKRGRCRCWIQDEDSSVVWGMPGSIHDAGLADEIIPLQQLAHRINQVT